MLCCAGCYWSIEAEEDQRFVEITIEKGGEEQWKQILETDSSVSAKAKVTDHVFFDIEEVSPKSMVNQHSMSQNITKGGDRSRWVCWRRVAKQLAE
jgi:hypothetical protein